MAANLTSEATATSFRVDIQALRAVAVGLVLLFHAWPSSMPGGYVGVDVFFVVSGFLITGLLLKEARATGTISLSRFYLRRMRRLIPASSLVLCVSIVAGLAWLDGEELLALLKQAVASALYVQNWVLMADSVDYLAADNAASAVQHYWSLSIEEQFYLIWPPVLLLMLALCRKAGVGFAVLAWCVMGTVATLSLGYGIWISFVDPAPGYFNSFTRIWELAAGGLLALLGERWKPAGGRARVAFAVGLGAILCSGVFYDVTLPFPGYEALLPVLGTMLVIHSAIPGDDAWGRTMGVAPVRFIGDISYSLYLWHWPVIVFFPHAVGRQISGPVDAAAVVLVSVALAAASKRWVEDRFRSHAPPRGGVAEGRAMDWVMGATLTGGVAIAAAGLWGFNQVPVRDGAIDSSVARGYHGALPREGDVAAPLDPPFLPLPGEASMDRGRAYGIGNGAVDCIAEWGSEEPRLCEYGGDGGLHIALVGDSHAAHWLPTFEEAARHLPWRVTGLVKDSCAFSAQQVMYGRRGAVARPYVECDAWKRRTLQWLLQAKPDLVVISFSPRHRVEGLDYAGAQRAVAEGLAEYVDLLDEQGIDVAVIEHTPWNRREIPSCMGEHMDEWGACATPRVQALLPGALRVIPSLRPTVETFNFDSVLCPESDCLPVIGNVMVYRDSHHMTATFAATMWMQMQERIQRRPSRGESAMVTRNACLACAREAIQRRSALVGNGLIRPASEGSM